MKQRCYENTYRISNNLPPSNSSFLSNWKEKLKNFKKRKESRIVQKSFPLLPSNNLPTNLLPIKPKPTVIRLFLRNGIIKRKKKKRNSLEIIMQSDRNIIIVEITHNRITLNKLAFNRLFSPDPLEFVRGSAALPSHTWNLRGWHTLSGGVPCSRCVFTFKSRKLCQGSAACINKSASRCARYVSLSLGW